MRPPVLLSRHTGFWHARDPRVKWLVLGATILLIYLLPNAEWMAALFGAAMIVVALARPPLGWLAVVLAVHIPTVFGLVGIPLLAGEGLENLDFGLRLALGWMAAIVVSIGLLATMEVPDMVYGLRGLGLPRRFAFVTGYAVLLVYLSLGDLVRVVDSLRLKGYRFSLAAPKTLARSLVAVVVPVLSAVARRGGTMAVALDSAGEAIDQVPFPAKRLDGWDRMVLILLGLALVMGISVRLI